MKYLLVFALALVVTTTHAQNNAQVAEPKIATVDKDRKSVV